jgi:hypothetical protein
MDAALEQLGQSIHKRPQHTHIVIVPRLMTYCWRKLLGKICDIIITVPLGTEGWSLTNFEPLIVGIYFPLCRHEPWRLKGHLCWSEQRGLCVICHRLLLDGVGLFCANYSFKRGSLTPCRQAWCGPCYVALDKNEFPIALPSDEDGLVTTDPKELKRYLVARSGDHLITPFQCDWCHFENLTGRRPESRDGKDQYLMKTIRRAQLDAFWATEPSTVSKNLSELRRGANIASALGCKPGMFRPMGPYPSEDTFGMGPAVVMLQLSTRPGSNEKHVQYNTVRRFRAAYSNVYNASTAALTGTTMVGGTKRMGVTNCPTHSEWFTRFSKCCHKRMGDNTRPNRAISITIMQEIFRQLEHEWSDPSKDRYQLALEGAYYIVAFCCALRGEEIGKSDLTGIRKHYEDSGASDPPHVVVALLGRFKGENGTGYLLMPLVVQTMDRSFTGILSFEGNLSWTLFQKEDGSSSNPK